jgi:hypothetical protein
VFCKAATIGRGRTGTITESSNQLTIDLLAWIARHPRTYAEVMDAWRSTCPRFTIWEDALGDGLIQVENGTTMGESTVTLTMRGRAMLDHLP